MRRTPPRSTRTDTLVPSPTLVRSDDAGRGRDENQRAAALESRVPAEDAAGCREIRHGAAPGDGAPRLTQYVPRNGTAENLSLISASVARGSTSPKSSGWIHRAMASMARMLSGLPLKEFQRPWRSEENTSELQSLMRLSSDVFCLKKKKP